MFLEACMKDVLPMSLLLIVHNLCVHSGTCYMLELYDDDSQIAMTRVEI